MLVFGVLPRSPMLPQAQHRPIDGQDVKFGSHFPAFDVWWKWYSGMTRPDAALDCIINDGRPAKSSLASLG